MRQNNKVRDSEEESKYTGNGGSEPVGKAVEEDQVPGYSESQGAAAAGSTAAKSQEGQPTEPQTSAEAGDPAAALTAVQTQAEEYLARLQRLQADFENFRRRTRQERDDLLRFASEDLICKLLPVLDNMERALVASGDQESLHKGVEMVYRQFLEVLGGQGLTPVCAVGQEFDPNLHQAVMQIPSPAHADNTVVEELQKGYQLKDKVIRPAMVKVANNS